MPAQKTSVFGTRLGFYLAAIGSALGLGNLWRFPYVAAQNGGGAFVLLYLALVFLIGMPILIAELSLGKISKGSLAPALLKLMGERYMVRDLRESSMQIPGWMRFGMRHLGTLSMGIVIVVLAYYAVISGWVLHFFMQSLVGLFDADHFQPGSALKVLLSNGWLQLALTSVHLLIVSVIVANDLEFGLEKWVGYLMPMFGILLIGLALQSLRLESAGEALRFLFYPDFSKLSLASLGEAVGHVFFTLSVGFGTMVTFGSYLNERVYVPIAGFRVCMMDAIISLSAGAMIFPLVISEGSSVGGPALLFQTVPNLLTRLPGGLWFGVAFFLCLYLASLGASIGLFESVVANWRELRRVPRATGATMVAGLCLVLAVGPAMNTPILKILDSALVNWCLPISVLLISQVVAWYLKQELKKDEFHLADQPSSDKLFKHWHLILRYLVSPVIVVALLLQVISLF